MKTNNNLSVSCTFMHRITIFCVLLSVLFCNMFAHAQTPVVPEGSGTSEDPYCIEVIGHLVWMSQQVANGNQWSDDKYFSQMMDIDATATKDYDNGAGFAPIGNIFDPYSFMGVYLGNGYSIDNLTINRPSSEYVGLFGHVNNGRIERLTLKNASIRGDENVGGIAAYASINGRISDCKVTGTVSGNDYVGGVVGNLEHSSTMEKSRSFAQVNGANIVGGVLGNNKGDMNQCFAMGTVCTTGNYAGGLVGANDDRGTISNCYAALGTLTTTGEREAGGLAGMNSGTVTNCYAAMDIFATGVSDVGGLIGSNTGSLENCYYDAMVSHYINGAGKALSTEEMKTPESYIEWDFYEIWSSFPEQVSYPYLNNSPTAYLYVQFSPFDIGGKYNATGGLKYIETFESEVLVSESGTSYTLHFVKITGKKADNITTFINKDTNVNINVDYKNCETALARVRFFPEETIDDGARWRFINDSNWHDPGKEIPANEGPQVIIAKDISGWADPAPMIVDIKSYQMNTFEMRYVKGNGTEGGPYEIKELADLEWLAARTAAGKDWTYGKFFRQMNDIDCIATANENYNNGKGWVPIGTTATQCGFGGYYAANNTKITNLFINSTDSQVGLFGYCSPGAEITDLKMDNVNITGGTNVGALVGKAAAKTKIQRCSVEASQVKGTDTVGTMAGFMAGAMRGCTVNNLLPTTGTNNIGGLVGTLQGDNTTANGLVDNCQTTVTVSGTNNIGGLVAYSNGTNAKISNCSTNGNVFVTESKAGGLVAENEGATIDTCSAATNVTSIGSYAGGVVAKNTNGLIKNCTSLGGVYSNNSPDDAFYGGIAGKCTGGTITSCTVTGSLECENGRYAGGVVGFLEENGKVESSYCTARVKNFGTMVGGLVGGTDTNATILYCFSESEVHGGINVGGLVGINHSSLIDKSYATGKVTGKRQIGGLVGENSYDGRILDCYATSAVSGEYVVGGLVGTNRHNIDRCFAAGAVTITEGTDVGGLVGIREGGVINQSCWDEDTTGQRHSDGLGGNKLNTAEMKTQSSFQPLLWDWDFENVWQIAEHISYPFLRKASTTALLNLTITPEGCGGKWTADGGSNYLETVNVTVPVTLNGNTIDVVYFRDVDYTIPPDVTLLLKAGDILTTTGEYTRPDIMAEPVTVPITRANDKFVFSLSHDNYPKLMHITFSNAEKNTELTVQVKEEFDPPTVFKNPDKLYGQMLTLSTTMQSTTWTATLEWPVFPALFPDGVSNLNRLFRTHGNVILDTYERDVDYRIYDEILTIDINNFSNWYLGVETAVPVTLSNFELE